MDKLFNLKISPVVLLALTTWIFGQFTVVDVRLETNLLRGDTHKTMAENLRHQIESYFRSTEFAPDAMDIEMVVDMHLIVEEVIDEGAERLVKVQAIVSNKLDQQYYCKGGTFPYSDGQAITFGPMFDPLASLLDFYAFTLIAGELDTYELLGGTSYLNRAQQLADDGLGSSYSRGWDTRYKRNKELLENVYLRSAKLYYFLALDVYNMPRFELKALREPLMLLSQNLEEVSYRYGPERFTLIFLKAHAETMAEMLHRAEMTDTLELLLELDKDNEEIYLEYLPHLRN